MASRGVKSVVAPGRQAMRLRRICMRGLTTDLWSDAARRTSELQIVDFRSVWRVLSVGSRQQVAIGWSYALAGEATPVRTRRCVRRAVSLWCPDGGTDLGPCDPVRMARLRVGPRPL